jgi:DNA polymerase V
MNRASAIIHNHQVCSHQNNLITYPLYSCKIEAGFPSPANDFIEGHLNLHDYVVKHPVATYFVRAGEGGLLAERIFPGDLLVVDRSLEPVSGKMVIAVIEGSLVLSRIKKKDGFLYLERADHKEVPWSEEISIWGVVTFVIHKV